MVGMGLVMVLEQLTCRDEKVPNWNRHLSFLNIDHLGEWHRAAQAGRRKDVDLFVCIVDALEIGNGVLPRLISITSGFFVANNTVLWLQIEPAEGASVGTCVPQFGVLPIPNGALFRKTGKDLKCVRQTTSAVTRQRHLQRVSYFSNSTWTWFLRVLGNRSAASPS